MFSSPTSKQTVSLPLEQDATSDQKEIDILKTLNIDLYKSMLPYAKANLELAKKYVLAEDHFFDRIMNLLNNSK